MGQKTNIHTKTVFAFDLDGTITAEESLPALAKAADCQAKITELTRLTVAGAIPFAESFARRVELLRHIPVNVAQNVMANLALNEEVVAFIKENRERCVIVTGNLDLWAAPVAAVLGCPMFSSTGSETAEGLKVTSIIDKGSVIKNLRRTAKVIAAGDGAGDVPMLQAADFGIAFAGLHEPPPSLVAVADVVATDGKTLYNILQKFL